MRIRLTRMSSGNSCNVLPIRSTEVANRENGASIEITAKPKIGFIGLLGDDSIPRVYIEAEVIIPTYGALTVVIDVLRPELQDLMDAALMGEKDPSAGAQINARKAIQMYMDGAITSSEAIAKIASDISQLEAGQFVQKS